MARTYKDSGIPWIGEIPQEWNIVQLKRYAKVNNGKEVAVELGADDENAKPVYGSGGVFKYTNEILYSGEAVMFGRKGTLGKPIYVNDGFWVVDTMYYLTYGKNLFPKYSYYQLSSFDWSPYITQTAIPSIVASDVMDAFVCFPPLSEQQRIAEFLDRKCEEIDELIGLQGDFIEELKAYKQSLITETVTRGLNPNAKLKPSGIDWIGEIPETWGIVPLKGSFDTGKGLTFTKADLVQKGVPVISYGQVHSKLNTGTCIDDELIRFVPVELIAGGDSSKVNVGDFIFADTSEDYDGCGNCVYVDKEMVLYGGYHSIVLHSKEKKSNKYFAYLFLTDCWRSQIRSRVSGIKVFSVSQSIIRQCSLLVPPLSEQQQIADYLDSKCSEIDNLIAIKQQKIEELKDYKKSIIYEYVTGKREIK